MKQKEALEILKMGHNAFVTGAAGSGKTHLLNEYIKYLREKGASIGITASTGIAATHMGGMTIHAWSGLGIRDALTPYDLESMEEKSYLWKRFENAHILIIDEVSMLHHFRLDLVDEIARFFKRSDKPFGGMQVILCGDFFQLPPISRRGEEPSRFAYHADAWGNLDLKVCYLEEQHRQSDGDYLEVLNAIRDNTVSEPILERLRGRYKKKPVSEVEPTKLYTHNADVDAENERELEKLPGEYFEYRMEGKGKDNLVLTLKKGCLAPDVLRIKKGARVMIVKNNFEEKYANGTLGIVVDATNYGIMVKIGDGRIITVKPANWKIEEDGKTKAEIIQYPLRLAWAITVHKSQGMSLDAAEVDLSQSFEKGMGYVALSRVRSLEGLSLHGMNKNALLVDEEVLEIDKNFRSISHEHATEYRKQKLEDIAQIQKEFIERVAPVNGKKEKRDTIDETKKLLLEGKTISEIALTRELKEGTIIDHIEKLLGQDAKLDLSTIKKSIPKDRLKKMTDALKKGGAEGGVYRLTPAKVLLGADFSFDEIRIARLFVK
ncbi:MAG: helix-turn-helix domain-containing protein [Patescibacteria group bacterium]